MKNFLNKCLIILILNCIVTSPAMCSGINNVQIKDLEKAYFGYDYPGESDMDRLDRLEQAIYGRTYQEESAQERMDNLYSDINILTQQEKIAQSSSSQQYQEEHPLPPAESDVKYPVVDKMEQKVLNKVYQSEDIYKRISRLEKQVFKKESTGSLNERVDALRGKVLDMNVIALDDDVYENMSNPPTDLMDDSKYNYYSYENSKNRISKPQSVEDDTFDIDSLERSVFGHKMSGSIDERLSKLEQEVFQRTFSDDKESRTQRLLAVTTAQKTAKQYDNNKWMNRLNTGIQIGGVILMILAMIL